MGLRDGYKMTEVGVIPVDWEVVEITDLVTTSFAGGTPSTSIKAYYKGNVPFITSSEINKRHIESVNSKISEDGLQNSSAKLVPADSILIALYGATAGKIAMTSVAGAINQAVLYIDIDQKFDRNYFFHSWDFKSDSIVSQLTQGGQPNLSKSIVQSIPIPLPPTKTEQRKIAAALGDADAWIRSLAGLLAKKRLVKTGVMGELLRPGQVGWREVRLGEVAQITTGSKNNQDKVENGQYPFFVRSQTVERINYYSYDEEAILVPGEGNIGKIFHYINGRFEVHQRVYKISKFSDRVDGKFVFFYMRENFGHVALENSVKATVDSLRLPTFQSFPLPLPDLPTQTRIATILSDMDAELAALEGKLGKARRLKAAMLEDLLTGRVRLV